jgi:hypothetical protein
MRAALVAPGLDLKMLPVRSPWNWGVIVRAVRTTDGKALVALTHGRFARKSFTGVILWDAKTHATLSGGWRYHSPELVVRIGAARGAVLVEFQDGRVRALRPKPIRVKPPKPRR